MDIKNTRHTGESAAESADDKRKNAESSGKYGGKGEKILKPIREKMSLDLIWVLEPRDRYKVVKALGLNYKAYFNRKGSYHCRNNC